MAEKPIGLEEARERTRRLATPKPAETISLSEALGRVLAEDVKAPRDFPPEARSRRDGFAVRSGDTLGATRERPVLLERLPGLLAAGHFPSIALKAHQCARVVTGAPLPDGADAVIAQEHVKAQGSWIVVSEPFAPGSHVIPAGEEARTHRTVLHRGTCLNPTALAILVNLGVGKTTVFGKPSAALLATGDEVAEPEEKAPGPGVFASGRYILSLLVRLWGGNADSLGIARDDPDEIARRLDDARADLVVTTGGTGHGERDLIAQVWNSLGIAPVFQRIRATPGHRTALGCRGSQIFLALSGNPWAARVIFQELAAPLLAAWQGIQALERFEVPAVITEGVTKRRGETRAIPGVCDFSTAPPRFHPSRSAPGEYLESIGFANAYVLLEEGVDHLPDGGTVTVRFFDLPLWVETRLKASNP
ncbi:molybdopterin molybdotransferase MoeA [Desulfoglaeba alkanexedens]|nr:molybdopterin molybdotransferase MoeA [Desulfoglaeba alkanexedens]